MAVPVFIQYPMEDCDAKVLVDGEGEGASFRQTFSRTADHLRQGDADLIRDAFLAVETVSDAVKFLRACGRYRATVHETTMSEIRGWQEFFREQMLGHGRPLGPNVELEDKENERVCGCLAWSIELNSESGQIDAMVDCDSALEAIAASVSIEMLEGCEFKACLWCKALFKVTKDNGRQYCSPACAHRGGQKRRRAEAKSIRAAVTPSKAKVKKGRG